VTKKVAASHPILHNVRDATPQTFVFWVHASTKVRFEEAYRDIADRLELSDEGISE
jgi:hypothetical protein